MGPRYRISPICPTWQFIIRKSECLTSRQCCKTEASDHQQHWINNANVVQPRFAVLDERSHDHFEEYGSFHKDITLEAKQKGQHSTEPQVHWDDPDSTDALSYAAKHANQREDSGRDRVGRGVCIFRRADNCMAYLAIEERIGLKDRRMVLISAREAEAVAENCSLSTTSSKEVSQNISLTNLMDVYAFTQLRLKKPRTIELQGIRDGEKDSKHYSWGADIHAQTARDKIAEHAVKSQRSLYAPIQGILQCKGELTVYDAGITGAVYFLQDRIKA